MSLRSKTAIAAALAAAGLAGAGLSALPRTGNAQWGVLALGLPPKVSTKNAYQSVSYYILKQTHEPVLRKDDGQNYFSNILNRWSRNIASTEYEFCPNTSLKFNAAAFFGLPLFLGHMTEVTRTYDPSGTVARRGDCVLVSFSKGRRGYLEFLTQYENAPTLKRDENIEDGLGKFAVREISGQAITLERKQPAPEGYNEVVFFEYKGKTDGNLQNRNIKDFNMIPIFDVPGWASNSYFGLNTVELKSINLIINHPDPAVRKAIYNCVDAAGLRKALYPLKKDFYDVQTILPIGMPGAKGGLPAQQCGPEARKIKTPLIFANWSEDSRETLRKFIQGIREKSGLDLKVVDYKPRDLAKALHSYPRPYNMVVIVLDAVRPNDTAFFEPFAVKNSYFDFRLGDLAERYKLMREEEDDNKKTAAAVKIADGLVGRYEVLTLYQNVKKLYYPKELKRLNVGKGFLQYPEVAALHL